MKLSLLAMLALLTTLVVADSQVWSFTPNFVYDPWNKPILPFLATVPQGKKVTPENIRAIVKAAELEKLNSQAAGSPTKRLVKRETVSHLKTDEDVTHAKSYLIPKSDSPVADVFQLGVGYIDKFGLVGILQLAAKFQCAADEKCPEKISQKLDTLLAKDGKIMKTETFFHIDGKPFILATITYEVPVGSELRVVPLRSRLLEVAIGQ